jgi:hypothetical protein
MYKPYITFLACLFLYAGTLHAQIDSIVNKLSSISEIDGKTIARLQKEYTALGSKISKQSGKILPEMQFREDKLQKKLNNVDSLKAQALFTGDVKQRYADLQSNLLKEIDKLKHFPLKEYIPSIDSVQTSLNFLLKNSSLPTDQLEKLQSLNVTLQTLQTELQKANDVQAFIREREAILKEQLLNSGLTKQLTGINKEVFYYQQELQEYKSLLNDRNKLKEKLIQVVQTLPAFQKFWQRNSYLAALFPMPANCSTSQALSGLQTRINIQSLINQRMGLSPNLSSVNAGGGGPFQQQQGAAEAQLDQLKNKLNKFSNSSGSSDMTMPDFNPNNQRTKSFLKRIEYGFNIQSDHGRYSLPATSEIAFTLGYKLNDKKTLGIGASYKIGWGSIQHVQISNEGVGVRSYIDIKSPFNSKGALLQSLWISGGLECNYLNGFRSLQELHENVNVWQRSALLGITKKYKLGRKEGNMQLLYDFLYNHQTPPGTAIKFRFGYIF